MVVEDISGGKIGLILGKLEGFEAVDPAANARANETVIGFGTIDDIDQLAGKRGDRQASAGQLEITSVLMESFAGANTVVRGNCTFGTKSKLWLYVVAKQQRRSPLGRTFRGHLLCRRFWREFYCY